MSFLLELSDSVQHLTIIGKLEASNKSCFSFLFLVEKVRHIHLNIFWWLLTIYGLLGLTLRAQDLRVPLCFSEMGIFIKLT